MPDMNLMLDDMAQEPSLEELRDVIDPNPIAVPEFVEDAPLSLEERIEQFKADEADIIDGLDRIQDEVAELAETLFDRGPAPDASLRMLVPEEINYVQGPQLAHYARKQAARFDAGGPGDPPVDQFESKYLNEPNIKKQADLKTDKFCVSVDGGSGGMYGAHQGMSREKAEEISDYHLSMYPDATVEIVPWAPVSLSGRFGAKTDSNQMLNLPKADTSAEGEAEKDYTEDLDELTRQYGNRREIPAPQESKAEDQVEMTTKEAGMKVVRDDLWLCPDCMIVAVNGDVSGIQYSYGPEGEDAVDKRIAEIYAGLEALGPHLVPDNEGQYGDGHEEFAHKTCACCRHSWGGEWFRFAVLGEDDGSDDTIKKESAMNKESIHPGDYHFMSEEDGSYDTEHAANELVLWIENDSDLQNHYQAIVRNLTLKMAKGVYDHALATKLLMYIVETGAKKYVQEVGNKSDQWHKVFTMDARRQAAEELTTTLENAIKNGEYDTDAMLPKKYKGWKPGGAAPVVSGGAAKSDEGTPTAEQTRQFNDPSTTAGKFALYTRAARIATRLNNGKVPQAIGKAFVAAKKQMVTGSTKMAVDVMAAMNGLRTALDNFLVEQGLPLKGASWDALEKLAAQKTGVEIPKEWMSAPFVGEEDPKQKSPAWRNPGLDKAHEDKKKAEPKKEAVLGVDDDERESDYFGEDAEFSDPIEPDEEDITTEDHNKWYQSGKLYFTGDEAGLNAKMEKDGFFPNVWLLDDHGGATLIDITTEDTGPKGGKVVSPAKGASLKTAFCACVDCLHALPTKSASKLCGTCKTAGCDGHVTCQAESYVKSAADDDKKKRDVEQHTQVMRGMSPPAEETGAEAGTGISFDLVDISTPGYMSRGTDIAVPISRGMTDDDVADEIMAEFHGYAGVNFLVDDSGDPLPGLDVISDEQVAAAAKAATRGIQKEIDSIEWGPEDEDSESETYAYFDVTLE